MEYSIHLWIYKVAFFLGIYIGVMEAAEYCHHETFDGRCEDNQVIVMTAAKYGRMQLGRCIKTDFGYIGCSLDVLDQAHARCSGRQQCDIGIPDPVFDKHKTCHTDLNSYLDASYDCVNISVPEVDICMPNTTNNVTDSSGAFASVIAKETGCGNEHSPWNILALPGQRINLTLMDFRRKSSYLKDDDFAKATGIETSEQILCKELAIVEEDDIKTPLSSCDGSGTIDPGGTKYMSMGHNISVYIRSRALEDDDAVFIIKYEVLGCPDIDDNKFTWVTRENDKVSIGCLATDLTWHLTCVGNTWHGESGNCSAVEIKEAHKEGDGTSVIIVLVVSGVVGVIVLLVGLYCFKKIRVRRTLRRDMPLKDVRPLNADEAYDQGFLYARNDAFQPNRTRIGKQKLGSGKKGKNDHDYEYVWDMSGAAQGVAPTQDGTLQTSACVVAARATPKSPRAAHATTDDSCHCPEIHVHVHHSMQNRPEGGQNQVSRVHIQTRADHSTMPRMAATISRTPGSCRHSMDSDGHQSPRTLRAITAPETTPSSHRKHDLPHHHQTVDRCRSKSKDRELDSCQPPLPHRERSSSRDKLESNKRYWTLPVKSAFKAKSLQGTLKPKPKLDTTG